VCRVSDNSTNSARGIIIPLQGDVTSPTSCSSAVQLALSKFGRLNILVNNVGILGASGTAMEVDMAEWVRGLEVNISSIV